MSCKVIVALFYICSSGIHSTTVSLSNVHSGEIIINGKRICGPSVGTKEAVVLCRHLYFTNGTPLPYVRQSDEFQLTAEVYDFTCPSNISHIKDCELTETPCSSSHDYLPKTGAASVLCYNISDVNSDGVKVVNGAGRVTLSKYGVTAVVCPDTWNDKAANVTCRTIGYKYGVAFDIHKGPYDDLVLLGNVSCNGNESLLSECETSTDCLNGNAVSAAAICYNNYPPTVQFNGQLGLYSVVSDDRVIMYCIQGQFYPHTALAPRQETPANTIACKKLIFVDKKVTKGNFGPVVFTKRRVCKSKNSVPYNCHGKWIYKSEWQKRIAESFLCGNSVKSAGTLYLCDGKVP